MAFSESAPSNQAPPQAPAVRLENQQLTDAQLVAQIQAGNFTAEIVEVELPSNRITAAGVAALIDSPIQSLQVLNLYDNQIGDAGAALIAQTEKFKGVNRLDVSYNGLTLAGVQALLGPDSHLTGPTWLNMGGNEVGDAGVQVILESPFAQHLRGLSLRQVGLTDVGARRLGQAADLARLQFLDVGRNRLSEEGRDAIATSPHLKQARIVFE